MLSKKALRNNSLLFFTILFIAISLHSECRAEEAANSGIVRFIEGQINTSEGTNHSRLSTDFIGGILTGLTTPAINGLMESLSTQPAATQSSTIEPTAYTVQYPGVSTGDLSQVVIVGDGPPPQPVNSQPQVMVVNSIQELPPGTIVVPYSPPSVSQEITMSQSQSSVPSLPMAEAQLGIGLGLDTFFVPPRSPNSRFEADMKLTWSFTEEELNQYNTRFKMGGLTQRLIPIGAVRLETDRSRFVREIGFHCDIGVDLKWNANWHNNVAGINLTDLAMEINDEDREGLGGGDVDHSDSVNLTDVPGMVTSLVEKVSAKLAAGAAGGAAKEAGDTLAGEIFDKMEIGVLVTQITSDRYVTITFDITAEDMRGNAVSINLEEENPIRFDSEGVDHILYARIPDGCPPLKKVTLRVVDAVYRYNESANIEFGISAEYIPVEVRTGKLTQGIGEYFANEHNAQVRDEDKPSLTVIGESLIYIPFHGFVQDSAANPSFGLEGVTVNIFARDNSFHKTEYTHPDGHFYGDFYIASAAGTAPHFITVSKEGYAPNYTVDFINDQEGFIISMLRPAQDYLFVSGQVLDMQNKPIPGAEVHVCGEMDVWAVTNAQGRFSFDVVRGGSITISAGKTGYHFPLVTKSTACSEERINVDLKANIQPPPGYIKLLFEAESQSLPPMINIKRPGSAAFSVDLASDRTLTIGALSAREFLTLGAFGYNLNPSQIEAQFSDDKLGEEKEFNITATPVWAKSIALSPPSVSIETGGINFDDKRTEEQAELIAVVEYARGQTKKSGVPVRFEMVEREGNAAVKFSREGLMPGCGYGMTDDNGEVKIGVLAYNTLGNVKIKAVALDKSLVTGLEEDELSSNAINVTIIPSTRITQTAKPTASVTAMANKKWLSGAGVRIEKGGEILFQFSAAPGQTGAPPLYASGILNGFKLSFSKDNGPWQDEMYETTPWATARRTFSEKGDYKVGFQVRENYAGENIWSDRAEAPFQVIEFIRPVVSLTIPNTTGIVNMPLDYSFEATAPATLENITLEFGDNKLDIDIDRGILSGKTHWSGSHYHLYSHEGTYQLKLKAVDVNNKQAEVTKTVTIQPLSALNDDTAPTGTLTINGGAQSAGEMNVVLHIEGSDGADGSGIFKLRISNDGANWNAWQAVDFANDRPYRDISTDRAWQLAGESGTKTVYVQLKDAAENVSNNIYASIQIEAASIQVSGSLAPPSVVDPNFPNASPPYGSISVSERAGNVITLVLQASNARASILVDRMAFSFDGTNWTGWMPFSDVKQISLIGHETENKIYVTFADIAGGQSPVYSADIPPGAAQPPAADIEADIQEEITPDSEEAGVSPAPATTSVGAGSEQQQIGEDRKVSALRRRLSDLRAARAKKRSVLPPVVPQGERRIEEETRPEIEPVDLSIEGIKVPREILINQASSIEVKVKNYSVVDIGECRVFFETEDGYKDKKRISLRGREQKRLRFSWTPQRDGRQKIAVSIECREDTNSRNNQKFQIIEVKKEEPVDVSIGNMRCPREIPVNQKADIEVKVKNESGVDIRECWVLFETEDGYRDKKRIFLRGRGRERVRFSWTPRKDGRQKVTASIECREDKNPRNNRVSQIVEVKKVERDVVRSRTAEKKKRDVIRPRMAEKKKIKKTEKERKIEIPRLQIRKLFLTDERNNVLKAGQSLIIGLEIESSSSFDESLEVNFVLEGKEGGRKTFNEKIKGLKNGPNSFKWELLKELKPDRYSLSVEVRNRLFNIREKRNKEFEVVNK
ncbi:MAG: carboxypeptidase-like regulatory domain-containing protein [Candidatus Ratteibacteria bacterium]|nr:carboxypeptidase-like regulatory domain-containing protein [Candidatus Ratteibacteria bacterium]